MIVRKLKLAFLVGVPAYFVAPVDRGSTVANYLEVAIRYLVAVMFLIYGLGKLLYLREFNAALANYKVVPESLVPGLARIIVAAEFYTAGACSRRWPGGKQVAISLLLMFSLGQAINLIRKRKIPCGCGAGDKRISWSLVARNLVMAGVIFLAA
jgi:hypothetical protein